MNGAVRRTGLLARAGEWTPQLRMAKSQAIRVLLFRTGQTEWERAGRIAGAADVPLSLEGFEAVRHAIRELGDVKMAAIHCGPDEASVMTATEVSNATGAKVRVLDELGEIHLGLWEGLLKSELEGKCPTTYRQWLDDPGAVQAPEGESFNQAQERIMSALGRSLSRAKADNGAMVFVLRPVAMALVGCALGEVSIRNVWSMLESDSKTQWHTLPRDLHRERGHRASAGA